MVDMKPMTRPKEIIVLAINAIAITVLVALTKAAGLGTLAIVIAVVGIVIAIVFALIANKKIGQARKQ
jgi:hypothetical protein